MPHKFLNASGIGGTNFCTTAGARQQIAAQRCLAALPANNFKQRMFGVRLGIGIRREVACRYPQIRRQLLDISQQPCFQRLHRDAQTELSCTLLVKALPDVERWTTTRFLIQIKQYQPVHVAAGSVVSGQFLEQICLAAVNTQQPRLQPGMFQQPADNDFIGESLDSSVDNRGRCLTFK